MGNPKGVRRDFAALEQRRLRAARLLEKGVSQAEVARQVRVHRQSVSRWARQLEKEGRAGLEQAGRAGRKPRLSAEDLERIERALKRGPEAFGCDTGLWTSARVADWIEKECGIAYHPGHVWRLLRLLGWSCQRPTGRSIERDEQAIARWKRKRWPEIKKSPKTRVRHRHRLRRRKRAEPETPSLPNLCPARTDSRAAVSLQLEDLVSDGWCDLSAPM